MGWLRVMMRVGEGLVHYRNLGFGAFGDLADMIVHDAGCGYGLGLVLA